MKGTIPPVYAIIPARGGSKRLQRKNVLPLGGKPLIAHSIEQAMSCPYVRSVQVTTDDREIADVARKYGAEVVDRPETLAQDTSTSESAVLHAMEAMTELNEDSIVLFMQCTSPVRAEDDLKKAIEAFHEKGADSMLSVSPCHVYLWRSSNEGLVSVNYDYRNRQRRQDMEPEYNENGSFYLFKPWVIRENNNRLGGKIALHVMDECVDIDSLIDFRRVEEFLTQRGGKSTSS
jgi:CMP-N,N'-diacetyllegionaminic acid synthase